MLRKKYYKIKQGIKIYKYNIISVYNKLHAITNQFEKSSYPMETLI